MSVIGVDTYRIRKAKRHLAKTRNCGSLSIIANLERSKAEESVFKEMKKKLNIFLWQVPVALS